MSEKAANFETRHPQELARQADANELCSDRMEIEKVDSQRLRMALLTDWNVRLRTHVRKFSELYGHNRSAAEFMRAMTTPPDSWYVNYQHGFTTPGAVEGSVIVSGPAVFSLLGDIEPFNLADWTSNVHPDDVGAVVEANMYSHDVHKPFDQIFRVDVEGGWKWVRASSRSVVIDESGNHCYSGLIMDYSSFIPEGMQVIAVDLGDEISGDESDDV